MAPPEDRPATGASDIWWMAATVPVPAAPVAVAAAGQGGPAPGADPAAGGVAPSDPPLAPNPVPASVAHLSEPDARDGGAAPTPAAGSPTRRSLLADDRGTKPVQAGPGRPVTQTGPLAGPDPGIAPLLSVNPSADVEGPVARRQAEGAVVAEPPLPAPVSSAARPAPQMEDPGPIALEDGRKGPRPDPAAIPLTAALGRPEQAQTAAHLFAATANTPGTGMLADVTGRKSADLPPAVRPGDRMPSPAAPRGEVGAAPEARMAMPPVEPGLVIATGPDEPPAPRPAVRPAVAMAAAAEAGPVPATAEKGAGDTGAGETGKAGVGREHPVQAPGGGDDPHSPRNAATGMRSALATDAFPFQTVPFPQAPAAPGDAAPRDASAAPSDRSTASHAAGQLAAAVTLRPDGAEVNLRPDELGPVRISIDRSAGETTVTLTADRPETLDLLRRHVDILASELRDAGVQTFSFQFGHGRGGATHGTPASFAQAEGGETPAPAELPSLSSGPAPAVKGAGLDLRL